MNRCESDQNQRAEIYGIAVLVASVSLLMVSAALAQQGGTRRPDSARGQGPGTGSVLEIPASRQQPQTAIPDPVAPMAPQVGPELEIPSRQLRTQPGYAQATVTVTDRTGTHITDLTKDDFRLYEDGQQRPIEFFRKDLNTPVSVGILVDTSGSMEPKIPQARAAIAEFIRDLNPRDDVFLFAFSDRPVPASGLHHQSRRGDEPARVAARLRSHRPL